MFLFLTLAINGIKALQWIARTISQWWVKVKDNTWPWALAVWYLFPRKQCDRERSGNVALPSQVWQELVLRKVGWWRCYYPSGRVWEAPWAIPPFTHELGAPNTARMLNNREQNNWQTSSCNKELHYNRRVKRQGITNRTLVVRRWLFTNFVHWSHMKGLLWMYMLWGWNHKTKATGNYRWQLRDNITYSVGAGHQAPFRK